MHQMHEMHEEPKHDEGPEDTETGAGGSGSKNAEDPPSPTKMELLKKLGVNLQMVQRIKEMDPTISLSLSLSLNKDPRDSCVSPLHKRTQLPTGRAQG